MNVSLPPIDALGNPMIEQTGCPNCGRRHYSDAAYLNVIEYVGAKNSGRDPNGPCSRACALQLEYVTALASRRKEQA